MTRLAELTGAQSRDGERGQIDVYIGGRAIVTGTVAHAIVANGNDAVPPATPGSLVWAVGGQPVAASSGEAASLFVTITDVVPRYTAALDAVAANLVDQGQRPARAGLRPERHDAARTSSIRPA